MHSQNAFHGKGSGDSGAAHTRNRAILKGAKATGMRIALLDSINCGDVDAPREAYSPVFSDSTPARRGFAGIRVCPSHPAGFSYLSKRLARYIDGYQDIGLDCIVAFPYDSGGCGCKDCWPWGARGYLTISKEFVRLARLKYPAIKFILGTWCYDVREKPDGEWDGLAKALAEDTSWVHYIMADSHFEFPTYPLEHGVPGGLPMINFAEISMWGRFPWGGFGANPLPERFQRIWDETERKLDGGLATRWRAARGSRCRAPPERIMCSSARTRSPSRRARWPSPEPWAPSRLAAGRPCFRWPRPEASRSRIAS